MSEAAKEDKKERRLKAQSEGDEEEHLASGERTRKPALVVNFYSWATPIVGAVALIAGLLLGYFGRPLVSKESSQGSANAPAAQVGGPTAQQEELMGFLLEEMRHFRGDADAPVTVIEFSDFL